MRFATSNQAKFKEVFEKLRAQGVGLERLDVIYPEVQADTLEEVVTGALEWLSARFGKGVMVDDSGLFVSALKGFPGVYSSYVYNTIGCGGILKLVEGREDRDATFRACFGFTEDGGPRLFTGECHGSIALEERGGGGFGFDPIFIPKNRRRTFAEMSLQEKNEVSHRGRAVDMLVRHLKGD